MSTATTLSLMGNGFIGSTYARLNGEAVCVEPRDVTSPQYADVLYTRSTTTNYLPFQGDVYTDIDTNLTHLMEVLPNVRGSFTYLSSWFVYAGSDWGHDPRWRAKEYHLGRPLGFYSATKACAEQLIESYCTTVAAGCGNNLKGPTSYQILRLSNVIGNDPRAGKQKNAMEHLLRKILANEEVPLYEGENWRDTLHVEDTCAAIKLVIDKGLPNEIYNVGRGESHKLEDILQYAIDKTGSKSTIKRVPVPVFHSIVQVPDFFMDTTKLRGLGFAPKYTIWESVDEVLERLSFGALFERSKMKVTPENREYFIEQMKGFGRGDPV